MKRRPRNAADHIAARTVLDLLAAKHAKDVFVAECKDGATVFGGHRRLDAWAMRRTWSPPTTIGYEVKVSRSDWLKDDKIADYLPLCHQLYIVAPEGVVEPAELPAECGLLRVTSGAGRLLTARKAPYRAIDWPGELMAYILMSRADIVQRHMYRTEVESRRYWKQWLEQRDEKRDIGHRVARALRERYVREVTEVQLRQRWLEKEIKAVDEFKRLYLERTGKPFRVDSWRPEKQVDAALCPGRWLSTDEIKELERVAAKITAIVGKQDDEHCTVAHTAIGGAR